MATPVLPQGTKEFLIVDVDDASDQLTTLVGTTPKYDIKDSTGTLKVNQGTPTAVGMRLYCLADTTAGGLWAGDTYRLYVNFITGGEAPKIGPMEFIVSAA